MRCRRCRLACKLYGASAEQARRRNHIRDPLATRRPPRVRCQQRSRRPPRTDVCLGREEEAKDKENGKCHDDGDGTPGRSDRMVMDLGACAVPVPEEVASRSQLAGFRRGGQAARPASFHAEEYHRTASTSAHMCAVCVRRRLAAAAARKNNSAVRAISACGTTTHSRIVESIPPALGSGTGRVFAPVAVSFPWRAPKPDVARCQIIPRLVCSCSVTFRPERYRRTCCVVQCQQSHPIRIMLLRTSAENYEFVYLL